MGEKYSIKKFFAVMTALTLLAGVTWETLIPAVMAALNRTGLVRFVRKEASLQKAGN